MTAAAAPVVPPVVPAAPPTEAERQAAAKAVTAAHRAKNEPAPPAVAPVVTPTVHERPEGVPEKFFNKDTGVVDYKAWGAAHSSLETQFHTKPKTESAPQPDPVKTAAEAAKAAADAAAAEADPAKKATLEAAAKTAKEAAEKAAADAAKAAPEVARKAAVEGAQAEYATTGKLSDASYAALAAVGYDRAMVDTYIAGQQATANTISQAAYAGAENEANYTAMLAWAEKTLTPAEIDAYDAQIATKNPAVIKVASAALYARYKTVAPVEGQRVAGGAPAASTGMYNSKSEMTAAVNDPRYKTDAAFQAQHAAKMRASRAAGINLFL